MRKQINTVFSWYFKQRIRQVQHYMNHPHEVQFGLLREMIDANRYTEIGRKYDFSSINSPTEFAKRVPVHTYDDLAPYIKRMMLGEKDILTNGIVDCFAKSAGTTSDKSKFIPVTPQNLKKCHLKGTWDTMTLLYYNRPDLEIFGTKNLVMGGALYKYDKYPSTTFGDVSAIMINNIPAVAKGFYAPDLEIALLPDLEEKLVRMSKVLPQEDLAMIGGVPTWMVVLFRLISERTGNTNMLEVWPNLKAYIHGGVSMKPYREQFKNFIPDPDFTYQETYNASEGYFGAQSDLDSDDMLLFMDNGMYFEFLPPSEWDKEFPKSITLENVEVGKNYALVITTNAGLWRYLVGDTISFTSIKPFKFRITGRTKQFINAFGEEVMVENTDKAVAETCAQTNAMVREYTVAPIYFKGENKGGHEWLIEFEKEPESLTTFNDLLDRNLQRVNSDYEAKRTNNMALEQLQMKVVPNGTFYKWMKHRGKLGGQGKVPRLANNRIVVEEILHFMNNGIDQ